VVVASLRKVSTHAGDLHRDLEEVTVGKFPARRQKSAAVFTRTFVSKPTPRAWPAGPVLERSTDVDKRALRVLVVDDERLIRWAIGETLTGKGHTVVEACDAAAARQLMQDTREPVNVVLLDYCLPDSHDFRLLDDLHRLSPASGVVIMTAQNDPALTAAALDHGARRVLDKPFDLTVLDAAVREAAAA